MSTPSYVLAMQLIELVAPLVVHSPDTLSTLRSLYPWSVQGQEAIHEMAGIYSAYDGRNREQIVRLREQLVSAMEFERLAGRVRVRFTHDVMGEDYIEGLTLVEARRWILQKMEQARPTGPIRWDDKGLVCEAESVWREEPTDATEYIARARGEITIGLPDGPRAVR